MSTVRSVDDVSSVDTVESADGVDDVNSVLGHWGWFSIGGGSPARGEKTYSGYPAKDV